MTEDKPRSAPAILFRTATEIAGAIGVDHRRIPRLVREEGLPAWKEDGKWKAIPDDLLDWLKERRSKHQSKS